MLNFPIMPCCLRDTIPCNLSIWSHATPLRIKKKRGKRKARWRHASHGSGAVLPLPATPPPRYPTLSGLPGVSQHLPYGGRRGGGCSYPPVRVRAKCQRTGVHPLVHTIARCWEGRDDYLAPRVTRPWGCDAWQLSFFDSRRGHYLPLECLLQVPDTAHTPPSSQAETAITAAESCF